MANFFDYLRQILNIHDDDRKNHLKKIFNKIAYTNLIKCSTNNEQQKLKDEMILPCFEKWFLKELELIKPKAILPLGNEASKFLEKYKKKHKGIFDEIYLLKHLKHPSRAYPKKKIPPKLIRQIQKYLEL